MAPQLLAAGLLGLSFFVGAGLASAQNHQIPLGGKQSGCPDYTRYSTYPHRPLSEGKLALPFQRPDPRCRTFTSEAIEKVIKDVTERIADPDLARLFENTYPSTTDTTVKFHTDGQDAAFVKGAAAAKNADEDAWQGPQSFIITGDIIAEWLRDSTNQLRPYQPLANKDKAIFDLILGAINTQSEYVIESPYCNAFQPPPISDLPPTSNGQTDRVHPAYEPDFVFECKYELDSLAHFLALGNDFYEHTGSTDFVNKRWVLAVETLFQVLDEQSQGTFDPKTGHFVRNAYTFQRTTDIGTETLNLLGVGNPINSGTGLIRSSFRPSDDATILPFFIPANAQMSVELGRASKVLQKAGKGTLAVEAKKWSDSIRAGIMEHGIVHHKKHGDIFAAEVDGYGSHILMDDANYPSLLALPIMGFCDKADPVYKNTRKMLLSKDDHPYYLTGSQFKGIGGPHIGLQNAWPMSLLVQAQTSDDDEEIMECITQVLKSSLRGLIHESIHVEHMSQYTRSWFAWANGVFAVTILDIAKRKPELIFKKGTPAVAVCRAYNPNPVPLSELRGAVPWLPAPAPRFPGLPTLTFLTPKLRSFFLVLLMSIRSVRSLPGAIRRVFYRPMSSSEMLLSRHPINFLRGWPAPELLPASLLSSATQTVLQKQTAYTEYLEYGADEGLTRLRKGLAKWMASHYGTKEDVDRITITGGASQNLACVLQSFSDVNATRAVWIVAPCYFLASGIFEDAGFAGRLKAVPEDEEGVDMDEFERRIAAFEAADAKVEHGKPFKHVGPDRKLYRHLIYCVPTSSNPSGKTMSLRRRQALVKLAQKHDALIISDDVYDFLQWPVGDATETKILPRLCDLDEPGDDGFGHTISNASFSKIAAPGVRTGWIEAAPKLAAGLARTASTMSGGCPSQLCSAMLAELVEAGTLQKYVQEELRPALKRRHALLSDAVSTYLGPLGVTARESCLAGHASYGGYFVWVDVSSVGFPAHVIADAAKSEDNIVVGYGNMFAVKGDEEAAVFDNHIRLCFAWLSEEDIVDGVKRLGVTMSRMVKNREQYMAAAAKSTAGDAQDR